MRRGVQGENLNGHSVSWRRLHRKAGVVGALIGAAVLVSYGMTPVAAASAQLDSGAAGSGFHYLTNFRTTHLSGRFVTAQGTTIPNAVVYLALNQVHDGGPEVQKMDMIAETHTTATGAFAFTVPKTTAVLDAARRNHGNLNLIMRAMTIPTGPQTSSTGPVSSAPPSDGTIGQVCIPATVATSYNCPAYLNPPTPTTSDVLTYTTKEPDHYAAQVATWAGSLIDPFSMYPNELVAAVDPVQNLTLRATDGVALLTANAGSKCVKPVSSNCNYDPITIVNAYPQEAIPANSVTPTVNQQVVGLMQQTPAAPMKANPPDEPGYCWPGSQWVQTDERYFEAVTDMHAYWDVTISGDYREDTTSQIGVSVRDDSNGGNWSVEGNTSHSSGNEGVTGAYGPYFAQRLQAYHEFYEVEHDDQCEQGNYDWDYYWTEISDQGFRGSTQTDNSNLSWEDGPDQLRYWEDNYHTATPYASDGRGYTWTRRNGKGYHYGGEIGIWGVTLGGETDWNQQVSETWTFGHGAGTHYLFGHDGPVTSSSIVFSD